MSPRVVLVALASALALLALAGCGLEGQPFDSGDSTADVPELGDAVVTPDAIAEYPQTSPEAAALTWWRAIQTRDPQAAIESYGSKARKDLPKDFPTVVVALLGPPAAQSPIAIDYVESANDDEATVYAIIDSPDPRVDGPLALPMEKVDDEWKITDTTFVATMAEAFRSALKGDVPPAAGATTEVPPAEGSQ
jgi:hypothetical protein